MSASATVFSSLAGGRPLQRERRDFLGNVFDLDIHAQGVLAEPAQAGVGGGPAVGVFVEARDGAVVDHLALLVAPAAVDHLAHADLVDVAGDDAVHQLGGVFAGDQVLVERRDVDERGGVADGVVLVLVMHLVDADRVVARPLAVVQAVAERESSLVKCGSDWQRSPSIQRLRAYVVKTFTTKDTEGHEGNAEAGLYAPCSLPATASCVTSSQA